MTLSVVLYHLVNEMEIRYMLGCDLLSLLRWARDHLLRFVDRGSTLILCSIKIMGLI